ncbi:MAG: DMT family transporter, partial [Thermoleophilia bacterium]
LLFALAFGAWWAHERLPTTVWVASAFLVGGLALFLVAGDASGTGDDASDLRWMMAGIVVVPIVVVLALFAYRRTGPARAVAFGIVAGILFGVQSSLLKAVTLDWGTGLIDELGSWKPWAVIIAGIGGFLMQQAAFQSGSIALSLPPVVVLPPLTAAAVAIFVLGGSINMSGLHGVAVVAAVLAIVGGQVAIAKVEAGREQIKAARTATPGTP